MYGDDDDDDDDDDLFSFKGPPDKDSGGVRRTDPETSHEAADSVEATKLEAMVRDVIARTGKWGATWDEQAKMLPEIAKASISPRWRPLRDKGMIKAKLKEDGKVDKRPGVSGRGQIVWIAI